MVDIEIRDASPWRCCLPLDKRSRSVDRQFFLNASAHQLLYSGGCSCCGVSLGVGVGVCVGVGVGVGDGVNIGDAAP